MIFIFWLGKQVRTREISSCGGKLLDSVTAPVRLSCLYIITKAETEAVLRVLWVAVRAHHWAGTLGKGWVWADMQLTLWVPIHELWVELHLLKSDTWASGGPGNTRPPSIIEKWAGSVAWPREQYSEMGKCLLTPPSHWPKHKTEEALGRGGGPPALEKTVQALRSQVQVRLHRQMHALCCCSVAKSCLTLGDPMHCSTPGLSVLHYPGIYSNSCPLSQRCHPTIFSFVAPFSSCLQSFPASEFFPMSQLFPSGIGASASACPSNE